MTNTTPPSALARKLAWRLNRLRCMSPAEIVYRLGRSLQAQAERLLLPLQGEAPLPDLEREGRPWIWPQVPVAPAPYLAAAERILAGRYDVFDLRDIELGDPPDWNRDPRTGTRAPLAFGKTLDYRDERLVGDIKCLWEPNRHLHLVTLAQAWRLSGEQRYLDAIGRHVTSWIEACPFGQGPNWVASLEAGIRLINWSLAWQLIGGGASPLFAASAGERLRQRWLASVHQHQRFIVGHFSLHSSANNHLLGEASGLFVAATTWPMWPQSRRWQRLAKRILEREALLQNAQDGVNREQAVWYGQFVFDFLFLPLLAGKANGEPFPAVYQERLDAMLDFVASLMDAGGHVPMIGDGDNGLVACLDPDPPASPFHSLLATGAVHFGRARFPGKAGYFDDRSRWLLGESARERFQQLAAQSDPDGIRQAFADGGYYVLGCGFDQPDEVRIVADAGPLGYLSIAAHGHADALAFTLSLGGTEILIDPGTYCYHTEKTWREYFRGTSAHNTVVVDGVGQSVSGGNFLWLKQATCAVESWQSSARADILEASHDGYTRLADPVTHRRRLAFDKPARRLEVRDEIVCAGAHELALYWHFAENCDVRVEGAEVTVIAGRERLTLWLPQSPDGRAELLCGSLDPIAGWISRRFGQRIPSPTLVWRARITGTTTLLTTLDCAAAGRLSSDGKSADGLITRTATPTLNTDSTMRC